MFGNLKSRIVLFLIIAFYSFFLDQATSNCKVPSMYTYSNSFVHHILSCYLWFGSILFGHHLLHLSIILIAVLFQYFNKWRCIMTDLYNSSCKINIKSRHKDILYKFLQFIPNHITYYQLATIISIYDLYYILFNKK